MNKDSGWKQIWRFSPIPVSIVCALIGLVLLIWPVTSSRIIALTVAGVLCLLGIYGIIAYFRGDSYNMMLGWRLTAGLIALTVGASLFFFPDWLATVLPMVWGMVLLAGGFCKIQVAFDMKRMEVEKWWQSLLGAALSLILGILILANPFGTAIVLMQFIGASLLVEAIVDIISTIAYNRARKRFYPDRA